MRATLRSMLRVMLLVAMLAGTGAAVGASAASARPGASSETPGVPTSTVKAIHGTLATYCVTNYAPNSTVTIVNEANNAVGTIHTNGKGSGCTKIRVDRVCNQTLHETIVATGTDSTGAPATSQAIADVPPKNSPRCRTHPTPSPTPTCDPTQATLSVYVVAQGHYLRGTACGFLPGETVDLFFFSTPRYMANTVARADTTATAGAAVPKCIAPGHHTFELVGETGNHVATAQFTVTKAPGCAGSVGAGGGLAGGGGVLPTSISNSGGGPTGGLAFTGADILAMVLVALLLLVLGTIAVVTVRRRRTVPAA